MSDYTAEKKLARNVGITIAWWAHAAIRLLLAVVFFYYGGAKLVFGQFGFSDTGDALIAHGEMSPMGLLWRMVAFSPLFQFLDGRRHGLEFPCFPPLSHASSQRSNPAPKRLP